MVWVIGWFWFAAAVLILRYASEPEEMFTWRMWFTAIIMPPIAPILFVVGVTIGLLVRFGIMRKPSCFLTR
jgi:hypothetical protein